MTPSERLSLLESGQNPACIAKLPSGFAVMAENQYLPGYCLLLASPMVGQLNDLDLIGQARFTSDMALLGDAVMSVTGCKRMNYGIYGNMDPFLHVHLWPRFEWEPSELATVPPLCFPAEVRNRPENDFSLDRHGDLLSRMQERLSRLR